MPNFSGTWKMKSSENFDELLKVLGVNAMLRKVAVAAASNPHVEIRQKGETFYIKTSTTVRTTEINFTVGEEYDEETVDGRKCKVISGEMPRPSHSLFCDVQDVGGPLHSAWCHGQYHRMQLLKKLQKHKMRKDNRSELWETVIELYERKIQGFMSRGESCYGLQRILGTI
uniref:Cellular retinoic acid binding protein 1a n=1 Tax=Neogobius melanostomus TaxID=47308 RepID=A0A8C6UL52_9GOBI